MKKFEKNKNRIKNFERKRDLVWKYMTEEDILRQPTDVPNNNRKIKDLKLEAFRHSKESNLDMYPILCYECERGFKWGIQDGDKQ